jgi:4-hydroxyproline epimerase
LTLQNVERLTQLSKAIKKTLQENNITGDGAEIDHIELYGPAADSNNHARNFVLCPGGAYDRSPCGTGTSAKLACLAADGHLKPGAIWRQESILGTVFEGSYAAGEGGIMPSITGSAYVTAVGELWNDADDPLRWSTR